MESLILIPTDIIIRTIRNFATGRFRIYLSGVLDARLGRIMLQNLPNILLPNSQKLSLNSQKLTYIILRNLPITLKHFIFTDYVYSSTKYAFFNA